MSLEQRSPSFASGSVPVMQTVQEFAKARNLSKAIVDTWIYRHGLPVIQIGRRVYISDSDYETWITEHKKVVSERPQKSFELAIPKKCRKSGVAAKMQKIY